ncbi:Inorganic phosphate transporter 1-11 [Zea mays]|uniref:H(+)/Pi cotransporter n=2 Tax=Zea mays TaxID=4577 RepID=Q5CC71_MAIZE|nr:phosphate transporter protein 6 [Zea mays]AAY42390.1 inorganic phosphate transporter 6 [Zea mays]ACL98053.1 inorganic phosphate transporter 6 [Zea mays]AQK97063.1 phosphate transporter protein6 [Zea mays]AYO46924.1 putative inorganic phosphate transporter 1-6 [Zea mays]PWZ11902.1 Inorganic phosphate transporter 1-11 [Zea mays]|eukprot:NP_001105776.1 phosphate transporter protein 6 [Zea mays]
MAAPGGSNLAVLDALDSARTQMYHMKAIVIAGMGFFTDAYDLFCISTVSKLLGRIYYPDDNLYIDKPKPGTLPVSVNNMVTGVALVGTLMGQLVFGYFGDKLGRKRVYGITLVLMAACAIGSGLSFGSSAHAVIGTLCFFRFWLGFGIGGDYPLSATIMSEYSNKKTRGAFIAAVFAMQGVGIIFAGLVSMIVSGILLHYHPAPAWKENHDRSWQDQMPAADYMWRIVLMIGAFPALATFYWRMKMPETARYTALIEGNAKQAANDMQKVMDVEIQAEQDKLARYKAANDYPLLSREFARRHGLHLIGTATTWFLLDIAFYSQNLTQKDIFPAIKLTSPVDDINALKEVFEISKAMFLVALLGTFPGYWVTVALIDKMGRYLIQLIGFFMMSVFMLLMGVMYNDLKNKHTTLFALFYALTFFFANFGPNSTTFVLPAELFPTRVRSTCHAISAASGKAGAIVAAFGVQSLTLKGDVGHIKKALIILSVTNILGFFFTFLVPETMGRSLEEISGEDGNVENGPGAPAGVAMGVADVSKDDKMPVSSTEWQSSMHA